MLGDMQGGVKEFSSNGVTGMIPKRARVLLTKIDMNRRAGSSVQQARLANISMNSQLNPAFIFYLSLANSAM